MKFIVTAVMAIVFYSSCAQEAKDNNTDSIKVSSELVDSANKVLMKYGNDSTSLQKQLLLLDSAIRLNGNNDVAFNNKITVLLSMHKFKAAIATIDRLNSNGNLSHLLMLKGHIYEEQYKDTARAQIYYNKALNVLDSMCQATPDNKGYQITRAFTILFAKGKLQGIKAYNALLDKYPGDSSILRIKDQFYDFDRRQYLKSLWSAQ